MNPDQFDLRLRALEAGHDLLAQQSAQFVVALREIEGSMARGAAAGLREILTDDELMDATLERLRSRLVRGAAERTGRWLFDGLKTLFSKWLVIGLIFLGVAQFLGWAPAKVVFGWLTSGKGP